MLGDQEEWLNEALWRSFILLLVYRKFVHPSFPLAVVGAIEVSEQFKELWSLFISACD